MSIRVLGHCSLSISGFSRLNEDWVFSAFVKGSCFGNSKVCRVVWGEEGFRV